MSPDNIDQLFPSDKEIIELNSSGLLERRIAKIIAKSIRKNFGDINSAVKVIAKKTGVNPRAVRNWYEGKNPPNCAHLILMARHMRDIIRIFLTLSGRADIWHAYELQIGLKTNPENLPAEHSKDKKLSKNIPVILKNSLYFSLLAEKMLMASSYYD